MSRNKPLILESRGRLTTIADALEVTNALAARGVNTIAAARIYLTLAIVGPSPIVAIVRELKLPFSTVSRMIWDMSKLGLVEYTSNPGDRRIKIVSVTS